MKTLHLLIISLSLILISCQRETAILDSDPERKMRFLSAEEKIVVEADHSFSFKLMNKIIESDSTENVFISPLSVSYAFGMALNGANGSTYDAIRNALELSGLTEDQINRAFRSLIDLLVNLDEQVIFEIANSIWYDDTFPVLDSFLEVNKKYFDAEVNELDFSNSASVDIINTWVAGKTHDKIKEILDYIPKDAVMYLINAIYFKATWVYEFDEALTSNDAFYIEGKGWQDRLTMKTTAQLDYHVSEHLQAVSLPYGAGNYQMTVIMPAQGMAIDEFVSSFNYSDWVSLLSNMNQGKGAVHLPKFITEYKLIMNDILKNMGMAIAFSPDSANFDRIVTSNDIYISNVVHKTFVQVDEEGTEAAAVTLIECRTTSTGNDPELDFYIKFNRPFYYIIHEKESETIMFMGKMKNPQWNE